MRRCVHQWNSIVERVPVDGVTIPVIVLTCRRCPARLVQTFCEHSVAPILRTRVRRLRAAEIVRERLRAI